MVSVVFEMKQVEDQRANNFHVIPQSLIQLICQYLVDSGNFNSILNLRLTSRYIRYVVSNSRLYLKLKLRVFTKAEVVERLKCKSEFMNKKTNWKARAIVVERDLGLPTQLSFYDDDDYSFLVSRFNRRNEDFSSNEVSALTVELLSYIEDNKSFFSDKLASIQFTVEGYFGIKEELCMYSKLVRNICNEATEVSVITGFPSATTRLEELTFVNKVQNLEIQVSSTTNFNWNVFTNLRCLNVTRSSDEYFDVDLYLIESNVMKYATQKKFFQVFINLIELKTDLLTFFVRVFENRRPAFPNVKKLEVQRLDRRDDSQANFLMTHFPNLEFLVCFEMRSNDRVNDLNFLLLNRVVEEGFVPQSVTTLKTSSYIFTRFEKYNNLQNLYLSFSLEDGNMYEQTIDLVMERLTTVDLTILNLCIFNFYHPHPVDDEIKPWAITHMLNHCARILQLQPNMQVLTVRGKIQLKSSDCRLDEKKDLVRNWCLKNEGVINSHATLKYFIFGDFVIKRSDTIDASLMLKMRRLDQEEQLLKN